MDSRSSLSTTDIRRRFDRAAATFDNADFVHSVTRQGLFARLEPVAIDASVVVDLGCASGTATRQLAKRFRGARVIGVDLSAAMVDRCKSSRGWFSKTSYLQADACALPFAGQSIDVVFSNMLLPWFHDAAPVGREVSRILREGGLFIFATLGPDSLRELRHAWAQVDNYEHVNRFPDMHDVGDTLVRAGLRDPVLDVDRLSITYDNARGLFADLSAVGARNCLNARRKSLSGRVAFETMRRHLEAESDVAKLCLELELVYGHCWGGGHQSGNANVHIDPGSIPIRGG